MDDNELHEMYEGKAIFVRDFIKPTLIALGVGIKDAFYVHDELGERVYVVYNLGSRIAYVDADSFKGILKDVVRQIFNED